MSSVGDRVLLTMGDGAHERARIVAHLQARRWVSATSCCRRAWPRRTARARSWTPCCCARRPGVGRRRGCAEGARARATRACRSATAHDLALRVDRNREANDWLMRILSVILFAFTAIAVVNTLMMIGLHRARELALLRLVGATPRQIRAMARWEGAAIVTLGVGLGAGIALVTLMPAAALAQRLPGAVRAARAGRPGARAPPPPSASSAACWPAASRCGRARWTRSVCGLAR